MTRLDVRIPLRVGQDAARPVQPAVAGPSASSSGDAVDVGREKPQPVAVVVEDRPAGDQPDSDRRTPAPVPPPPPPARLVDLVSRKRAGRGSTLLGVDFRRLGRRCRSLDNVHTFAGADDHRTYALLMIAN